MNAKIKNSAPLFDDIPVEFIRLSDINKLGIDNIIPKTNIIFPNSLESIKHAFLNNHIVFHEIILSFMKTDNEASEMFLRQ